MSRARNADFHVAGKSLAWSARDRADLLTQAQTRDFDLVILGGGITGAGIAREAALRGISFLLVDKGDFAVGTSSRSSKLVHGGLRYLPQGDVGLVRESVMERNWLQRALPHLVRPLAFHYCAFKGSKDTPLMVRLGLTAYDLLSNAFDRFKSPGRHRFLKPDQMAKREPAFCREGLQLAGVYFDTSTDDARLTLETIKEARDLSGGRSVALNYVEAERIRVEAGRVSTVDLVDREGGSRFSVRASCVANATGVWSSETLARAGQEDHRLRPSKGVHVVVPRARIGHHDAFALRRPDDRFVFVLPRGEVSLIGTTDEDYHGPLDDPHCTQAECDYLLDTVNAYFPEARLGTADILSTYAGLRPLVFEEGSPSDNSRQHLIQDPGTGLVSITGGKLTTFRPMAWELLSLCSKRGYLRRLGWRERRRSFSMRRYKVGLSWEAFEAITRDLGMEGALPEATRRYLHQKYGQGAVGILREAKRAPELGQPLMEGHPFCAAEVQHILAFEQAPHLIDVMARRTEMALVVSHRLQGDLATRVAPLLAAYYRWDASRTAEEVQTYLDHIRRTIFF
ncbi:glycerol-3-phosphate dehydrogenase [Geothrix limicola]|uniref:Glycerol-3-phosphate dehydrogenase n=1 Tax=Geothrix limicola TaxID=2927978 RepID=A0ABQ5QEP2_9BACT|nr:glycerol-3-phosphate dehydrogenase/oxidase [Geothrix limicola]GLH72838.1 glycerol-3-phosphate dehydrogenase [Geothrix limicola]